MATEERRPRDLAGEMREGFAALRADFAEIREGFVELRTRTGHLETGMAELREEFRADVRRIDARLFQVVMLQVATLATIVGALVASRVG